MESVPTGGRGGRLGEFVMKYDLYDQRKMIDGGEMRLFRGNGQGVRLWRDLSYARPLKGERTGVMLPLYRFDTLWVDMTSK